MEPLKSHTGKAAVLNRINVDTDQIIPKQFLKRIERTGYGRFAFFDWRYDANGEPNPEFELNQPVYQGASILIAGENFGCGSSREHAPWALDDYGFKIIIAPSFADIFHQNCFKNGMLPIRMPYDNWKQLVGQYENQSLQMTVDLENQLIHDSEGNQISFEVDPHWKEMLINGYDEISLTLLLEDEIKQFESQRSSWLQA
ncbi:MULTISPECIES: 3-isopropylmalate dehydratase small subunit [Bacillus]|jgi:3-isopropylmalate/(R)-2-methylmalate dehydratase small subunit|uniref:3-isopropylmalate dehydratase small subunit n=5 Tax=Bacillus subtilis TaxID=1423 RepID=LEUD_BACSU|nr:MULTISPECIES: 3-isopropylmalate dehydratase small subunit [Bacillales]NP_390703.1 3-isopropylmalate dehydratase (small subunit) [Bacillus subtilis subsp. subtilis str. 168]P94568.1 RecName: Full=3-isopropylmalate dehydratase small subunit; AltName: Full=Alpha-IPM isomerase; Short=IPMI; AltName: Full=Isopropylmalate isomerase [Bacillus subtilis subsp. subtilis str. 168]BAM53261.1 isopropylmalate isomerase small subunit [Bacillus subtilis BEST7613]AFQ58671.1 3-isopropylmalate dehydratase (smal